MTGPALLESARERRTVARLERLDARVRAPKFSPDGRYVYFTVQTRGNVHLYRVPADGGPPEIVLGERGPVPVMGRPVPSVCLGRHRRPPPFRAMLQCYASS